MLVSMQNSGCCSVYSLLTSRHFMNSRNVLEGKAILVREQGKGKRLNKSCSFRHGQKEQLWQPGQFGYHSPMSVTNTLWWLFTLHFGVRGHRKHRRKSKIFLLFNCITFASMITKTRKSEPLEKYRVQIPPDSYIFISTIN